MLHLLQQQFGDLFSGITRKLWQKFLLEYLLCLFVINVIKGPFKMAIWHLSWDDASFVRLFKTQRKRTNGSYQSCRLTLQILMARTRLWRWLGKRKWRRWTDIWVGQVKKPRLVNLFFAYFVPINFCCISSVFNALMSSLFTTRSEKIFLFKVF